MQYATPKYKKHPQAHVHGLRTKNKGFLTGTNFHARQASKTGLKIKLSSPYSWLMKIIIASILATFIASSHADVGDQKLKQALLSLTETATKLKALSETLKGHEIFEAWCIACHTPAMRQLPPTEESPLMRTSNAELIKFILFSRDGAKHPPWKLALSPYEMASLSNYLQIAFKKYPPTELVTAEIVTSVIAKKYQLANTGCVLPKQHDDAKINP